MNELANPRLVLARMQQRSDVQDCHPRKCIHCGYTLLASGGGSGECPECGTSTDLSFLPNDIGNSDLRWLRCIVRGQSLILLGFFLAIMTPPITALIYIADVLLSPETTSRPASFSQLQFGIGVGAIVIFVGLCFVTMQDPRRSDEDSGFSSGSASRVSAALSIAFGCLAFSLELLPVSSQLFPRRSSIFVLSLAGLMGALAVVFLLKHLSKIAIRIPDLSLARRTVTTAKWFAWSAPLAIVTALIYAPVVVAPPTGTKSLSWQFMLQEGVGCCVLILEIFVFVQVCRMLVIMISYRRALVQSFREAERRKETKETA